MKTKRFLIILPIIALLFLQACSCSSLEDYLSDYEGSLWSPTVGDMIYLESANDTYRFGKPNGPQGIIQTTLTYNFLISQYEVTNRAFEEFVDDGGYTNQAYWTTAGWNYISTNGILHPYHWSEPYWYEFAIDPDQPVVGVSWHEAVAFTQWLSIKEGWPVAYDSDGRIIDLLSDGYRLPTEVEWEYAASKGDPSETERLYAWGNSWNCGKAVCSVHPCGSTPSYFLQAVGSKRPGGDTPQGLSDMSGNAAEMVSDTYSELVPNVPLTNGYIFDPQVDLILYRGGAWSDTFSNQFETSYRGFIYKEIRTYDNIGFRVARTYPIQ